jgi:hypothetical protein
MESLPRRYTDIDALFLDDGFEYEEEDTCEINRWCEYSREIELSPGGFVFRITMRFEITISDSSSGSYNCNHTLSSPTIELEIEESAGSGTINKFLGACELSVGSYRQIKRLIEMATPQMPNNPSEATGDNVSR